MTTQPTVHTASIQSTDDQCDHCTAIDLDLSCNEGAGAIDDIASILGEAPPSLIERYPKLDRLRALFARRFGVDPQRVVVTAGGDDGIDRAFRVFVNSHTIKRKKVIAHTPTFSMIAVYCATAGGVLHPEPWLDGPFPLDAIERQINSETALVTLVTPNNPTGAVIASNDLLRIVAAARAAGAMVLVDLAYVEFADADPTDLLRSLDNVVVVHTLSKAWGLAGLRVGCLIASAGNAKRLRRISGPYPVSSISIYLAERALTTGQEIMRRHTESVRSGRSQLADAIEQVGAHVWRGEGNFVLARFQNATSIQAALARGGIAIRSFPDDPALANTLRITCPVVSQQLDRLIHAIQQATTPGSLTTPEAIQ